MYSDRLVWVFFFFQRLKLITFGENLLISEVINFRKIQIAKRKKNQFQYSHGLFD